MRGVRNLDGRSDGHSGSVRQCLRQDRSGSARGEPDGHAGQTSTCSCMAAVACGSSGPDRVRPRRTWCHVRDGCHEDSRSTLPASLQRAAGHRPSVRAPRTLVWPATPAWPRVPDTSPSTVGRSGSSGRSIRRSLRLVTTSSTLPQGRPCGRPAAALGRHGALMWDGNRREHLGATEKAEPPNWQRRQVPDAALGAVLRYGSCRMDR
jgi:hypothetical protein